MKLTGFAVSLAFAGVVSSAAVPQVPGINGPVEGMEAAAEGTLAGLAHAKRQLEGLYPVTSGAGSTLNGVTGIAGSAAGTGESTVAGAVGTVENIVANTAGALKKRQLEGLYPVTSGAGSTLNGVTGIAGSAAGTGESTVAGAVGTVENIVANTAGALKKRADGPSIEGTLTKAAKPVGNIIDGAASGLKARQLDTMYPVTEAAGSSLNGITGLTGSAVGNAENMVGGAVGTAENLVANTAGGLKTRQIGNLPATLDQTIQLALVGLSGNPTGLYGALNNLRTIVNAGDISHEDLTNMPQAIQDVIAHLAVA